MPAERLTSPWVRLFDVRVLHHYWLDDGATVFDALPTATQEERLLGYDVRTILDIAPTDATAATLRGLQGTWRQTSLGLVAVVPDGVEVPDASSFEFTVRVVDPDFHSYTAYGLRVPFSADVYQPGTGQVFRYRGDAALYSNLTGCARGAGAGKQLFLAREAPARLATDRVEFIVNDGGALVQLLSDPPAVTTAQLAPHVADLPAFTNHDDVPAITPPAGVVGSVPGRGLELPAGAPVDTFALLHIAAVHPTDPDFSCTAGGVPKSVPPVFQLRFKNRRSLWRRFSKSSPSTLLSEAGPFPLTFNGNAGASQKPTSRAVKLDLSGTAITNIVSEIYI